MIFYKIYDIIYIESEKKIKNKKEEKNMEVKIIAKMTKAEKEEMLQDYGEGWTIEQVVFEMVGPYDDYQDIEVQIID